MMTVLTRPAGAAPDGEGTAAPASAGPPVPGVAPHEMPVERVEAELCTLAGQIAAATCRFLVLLADFDERRGWACWNVRSCAHWLSWRCGLDLRTAREHLRVAHALSELPRVRAAFEGGRLSYSKVRAIARVATPQTEADLLGSALAAPAAHLERLTRGVATAQRYRADDEAAAAGAPPGDQTPRYLRWRWDDDGSLVVWGRLAPEDGARFVAGLSRADAERRADGSAEPPDRDRAEPPDRDRVDGSAEPSDGDRVDGSAEPSGARAPDVQVGPPPDAVGALVAMADMACAAVQAPVHAPAAEVMVHVGVDTLVAASTRCPDLPAQAMAGHALAGRTRLDDGPALSVACAQRLACDGRIRLAVHGSDGRTLDIGRWRRRPTPAQRTALWQRDRGCAVPGCGRVRFLHAHHVQAWSRGGRTSLDNMLLLCGEHHRGLHDGEFSITALGNQRFRFHGPGGATCPAAPSVRGSAPALAAVHPDIRPDTIEPDWPGDPLDLAWAVMMLVPPQAASRPS